MGDLLDTYKEILRRQFPALSERFGVKSMGIFGSHVRREAHSVSDLDILVEFERAVDYFDFLELEEHLSEILGVPVDLVERQSLKPHIGARVMSEVVPI